MLHATRSFRKLVLLVLLGLALYLVVFLLLPWMRSINHFMYGIQPLGVCHPPAIVYSTPNVSWQSSVYESGDVDDCLNVAVTYVGTNSNLYSKLQNAIETVLLGSRDVSLCFHIMADQPRFHAIHKHIDNLCSDGQHNRNLVRFYLHDVRRTVAPILQLLPTLRRYFGHSLHPLYFLSLTLHRYFAHLDKLILLDLDVKLLSPLRDLYALFSHFDEEELIGIANEQQPVYNHLLFSYRLKTNQTKIGSPAPYGAPGVNSGVLLLHLQRMRSSVEYNAAVNETYISRLAEKYYFKGHLGDQDFYSLLSFENPHLFHVLDCKWNRQLCQWWRYHGYEKVFDDYYKCDGPIHLYHANCNSSL